MIDLIIICVLMILFTFCLLSNKTKTVSNQSMTQSKGSGVAGFIHFLAIAWTLICASLFIHSLTLSAQTMLSVFVSFVLFGSIWFFPVVGLELIALVTKKLSSN